MTTVCNHERKLFFKILRICVCFDDIILCSGNCITYLYVWKLILWSYCFCLNQKVPRESVIQNSVLYIELHIFVFAKFFLYFLKQCNVIIYLKHFKQKIQTFKKQPHIYLQKVSFCKKHLLKKSFSQSSLLYNLYT